MKNVHLTIAILILCSATQAFSQMRIGVKGAATYSKMHFKEADEVDIEGLVGPQAGLVVYSNLNSAAFFQTGLLYNTGGGQSSEYDVKISYSFVELPVNVGFQIPITSSFSLSPYIGGYAAYALTGKVKIGNVTVDMFDLPEEELEEVIEPKRLDYGANAGLGFHFNQKVILNVQYSHGFANLGYDTFTSNTRSLSAGLTFLF